MALRWAAALLPAWRREWDGDRAVSGAHMAIRHLKIICSALCASVLAANFWTMRHWTERTGVHDDIGYLRQADLFQRFGLAGLANAINAGSIFATTYRAADTVPLDFSLSIAGDYIRDMQVV